MTVTRMVLVRHGQTEANVNGVFHGLTDTPLNETGQQQALLVAARIGAEIQADALLSSPLSRARATATAISITTGLDIQERHELREMHFGSLEGFTLERLKDEHPELARLSMDPTTSSLEWPGGDRIEEFYLRSRAAFDAIAEEFSRRTVIVVSHGGVIGSYLRSLAGLHPNDWQAFRLSNCAISIVDVSAGAPRVVLQNCCRHMEELLPPAGSAGGR